MTTPIFVRNAIKACRSHSPEILTGFGIVGVISTAYLTGKAAYKSAEVLSDTDRHVDRKERFKHDIKVVWKLYIPATATGVVTIGCIFGSQRVNVRRAAAAAAAYSVAERGFAEYKERIVEKFGEGPEQKIRDKIVQDRVEKKPVGSNEIVMLQTGHVLCCELFTHRYFRSDMETLKKAENEVNQRIFSDLYVMLSEFYDQIGLPHTSHSDYVGWDSGKPLELRFSTVLSETGEPCLAFDYNYTKPV